MLWVQGIHYSGNTKKWVVQVVVNIHMTSSNEKLWKKLLSYEGAVH
jgi:hypothetical protein